MGEILLRVPQVGMVGKGIPCPEGRCRPFSPDCRGEGKEMGRGSISKLQPNWQAKASLLPVCRNKVLSEHSHIHSLHSAYSCFHAAVVELIATDRSHGPQIFTICPFKENSPIPALACSKILISQCSML